MIPINFATEIVITAYNPVTEMCSYTIERDDKRWTVTIPLPELLGKGADTARRQHLATKLMAAMAGPPDKVAEIRHEP